MTDLRPLREIEKEAIIEAMMRHLNCTIAAAKLGISARTLKRKMHEYGYTMNQLREMKRERTGQGIIRFLATK